MAKSVINPYNFVPLGRNIVRDNAKNFYNMADDLVSGRIEISIENKTPLIIPDAENVKVENDHKTFPALKAEDSEGIKRCLIPGSELRGMIRSIYETITNSCMVNIPSQGRISYRIPTCGALKNNGLLTLKNGSWYLYACNVLKKASSYDEVCNGRYNGKKTGELVSYKAEGKSFVLTDNGSLKGYLQFNTPIDNGQKYNIRLLTPSGKELKKWNDDEPYKTLLSALKRDGIEVSKEKEDKAPETIQNKDLTELLINIKEKGEGSIPVYYVDAADYDGKRYFLSPASIGRMGSKKTWNDIYGANKPCTTIENLCPACLLFGSISKNNSEDSAFKGRVRFADALCNNVHPRTFIKTLSILGGPKTQAYEFYMTRPNGKFAYWNYDYYSSPNMKESTVNSNPEIRGRKYYWHHIPNPSIAYSASKNQLNSTVEAIDSGAKFTGTVYFDQIKKEQLNLLLWSINLGGDNEKLCHKIGHGKPLGFGSIKIKVEKCIVRNLSKNADNIQYKESEYTASDVVIDERTKAYLISILDFTRTGNNTVKYPEFDNPDRPITGADGKIQTKTIMNWFAKNRENGAKVHSLPKAVSDDITLSEIYIGSNGENVIEHSDGFKQEEKNQDSVANTPLADLLKMVNKTESSSESLNKKEVKIGEKYDAVVRKNNLFMGGAKYAVVDINESLNNDKAMFKIKAGKQCKIGEKVSIVITGDKDSEGRYLCEKR